LIFIYLQVTYIQTAKFFLGYLTWGCSMSVSPRPEPRGELQPAPTLIGESKQATQMRAFAEKAAKAKDVVLLLGETGTGKDHLAKVIHGATYPGRAFVSVKCRGIPENLLETELFGHVAGAYTDARFEKHGLIKIAGNGTLFVDEVGDAPPVIQAKLLGVFEDETFRPVGGTLEIAVKARIITATNANLESAVQGGTFRSDLYYRLNVVPFTIPPLRQRREDVPVLIEHFLLRRKTEKRFSKEAMSIMQDHCWPGNVRELKHTVDRAVFFSPDGQDIQAEHIHIRPLVIDKGVGKNGEMSLPTFEDNEREYLREVLEYTGGNVRRAAKIAGIGRGTMYNKVRKFQLK